jgi:hypothetical protein
MAKAKAKTMTISTFVKKHKSKGVAAKNKTSNSKGSKLYKKPYKGQGR